MAVQATAKADVDPNLEAQVKALQTQAAASAPATLKGEQAKWMMPEHEDWQGDLTDWDELGTPFDRSASNEAFVEAVKDGKNPGTTGDLVVTTLQVDYLACMERAFKARHTMSRPRALAHAMGR